MPAAAVTTEGGPDRLEHALPADLVGTMTRPAVVLDTSVLMADPHAHTGYPDCDVVIPLTVIDELDRNKSRSDAAGRNARDFLRTLEQLRQDAGGDISTPLPLPAGAQLRVEPNGLRLDELAAHHLDPAVPDHRILAAALGMHTDGRRPVRVVSNDMALRLKAAVLGLRAVEHVPGRVGVHAPNRLGYHRLGLSWGSVTALKGPGPVDIDALEPADQDLLADVLDNEFLVVTGSGLIARRKHGRLVKVAGHYEPWGVKARNLEQRFALDLLQDPDIRFAVLRGHAGTGKSFLALAAGLQAVMEAKTHDRLVILRPMIPVGREALGFLPGDVAEKTAPWFSAVVDTIAALQGCPYQTAEDMLSQWIEAGKVELSPMTFLRGRSLTKAWVVLDEAQDCEPTTVKTVVSRLGEGSTLVLTGDDGQLDLPFASALTCGMNVAVDAFAGVDLFGQVFFSKGVRSRLADLAAERM